MTFAAASLRDVMIEQAVAFEGQGGPRMSFNFAGSNVLALQLEASPRSADIFLSADTSWMDHLERGELIRSGSRIRFLSNRLVVVAGSASRLEVSELADIAAPGVRYLALGNPDAVPAGRYARAALERVPLPEGSLWEAIEERVAPAADVRAVLALVEARRDTLGIVYSTDARSSTGTRELLEIPSSVTPAIVYSAAALSETRHPEAAAAFLTYLSSGEARAIFERHGFAVGSADAS